jgi:hypothetical protein
MLASAYMPSIETAARSLKVAPIIAPVHSDAEIEAAIVALGSGGGLVVLGDAFMTVHRAPTILAAARNNVPAVYNQSAFARDGGLLSYGPDLVDIWRLCRRGVRFVRGVRCASHCCDGSLSAVVGGVDGHQASFDNDQG